MEITLQFFVYAMEDLFYWPKVLFRIEFLLNNTFSFTTGKTPHKIAYNFLSKRFLDLILAISMRNTYVARINAADAISFAFLDQTEYDRRKH